VDSRAGLLHAALELISRKGYDAVGVQEIAEAAGVAKPTLYHFFGSKGGLLEALFQEHATQLDDAVRSAADYTGDMPRTLDRVASAYIEFAKRQPTFYRLELALYFAPLDADAYRIARRHHGLRHKVLEDLFLKAVREHGNMRGRHRRYAYSLVGMINSYITLQLNGDLVITDKLRREMVHQFSHGIYS